MLQLHALSCGAAPRAVPRAAAPPRRRAACTRAASRGVVVCAAAAPAANRLSAAFAAALARKQCVPARGVRSRRVRRRVLTDSSRAHAAPRCRPALIPFICAGDPNLATTVLALRALDEARLIEPRCVPCRT